MGLFDKFRKNKADEKDTYFERYCEMPRDDFKSKEYYIKQLKRSDKLIQDATGVVHTNPDADRVAYCSIMSRESNDRLRLLYVLRADAQEVKDEALRYCRNVREYAQLSEVTGRILGRALSFSVLFDLDHEEISFLNEPLVEDRFIDAVVDLLRSFLFSDEIATSKDFYFKDKGYFGDFKKDTAGLMKAINAATQEERTAEFAKFLNTEKEKHYKRLLKHYEEIGEERYVYTGSYDFRLTALAKVLIIDKAAIADSKFIASDLL